MITAGFDLGSRVRVGIRALLLREVVVHCLTFGGGIILARVLMPSDFGLFAIASFLVTLFSVMGDFGLAPSLIQRTNEITLQDLKVGFTIQQVLIIGIMAIIWIAAPALAALYPEAPSATAWLVRALAVNLFLSSWRTMSALQLERRLLFRALARVEMIEALAYQATAVVLAIAGYGVWAFGVAVLVRGLIGPSLLYAAAPWRIGIGFDWHTAHRILRFGIPFQLQTLVNNSVGWLTPGLVGVLVGPLAVGYLGWSSSLSRKPLVLVDAVMRVAFPHFSRLQTDQAAVERVMARYIAYLLSLAGLWCALIVGAGPLLVAWIYTAKWSAAVPALMLFSVALTLDTVLWVAGLSLNAVGRVGFTTRVVTIRALLTILLGIALVKTMGFIGVPIATVIIGVFTTPLVLLAFKRRTVTQIVRSASSIVLAAASAYLVGILCAHLALPLGIHAVLAAALVSATYCLVGINVAPGWLRRDLLDILPQRLGGKSRWSASAFHPQTGELVPWESHA
jgi:O-antigen/teichoic acid export membrane protein